MERDGDWKSRITSGMERDGDWKSSITSGIEGSNPSFSATDYKLRNN